MSHKPERKEKDCLNCGAEVEGPFCQVCGQENVEPKESFWGLITHFIHDLTHFDGKFFSTVKLLLFRPGFLTSEYTRGRRVNYLHPVRMYVFTAAFFFVIFFNFMNPVHQVDDLLNNKSPEQQMANLVKTRQEIVNKMKDNKDSVMATAMQKALVQIDRQWEAEKIKADSVRKKRSADSLTAATIRKSVLGQEKDGGFHFSASTKTQNGIRIDTTGLSSGGFFGNPEYPSVEAYDFIQSELPEDRKDHGWRKPVYRKMIYFGEQSGTNGLTLIRTIMERFLHWFPQIFFISLPIFALILKMLYNGNKHFYYAEHAIFAIHLYCATFLIVLVRYAVIAINSKLDWTVLNVLAALVGLSIFFYEYKAMHNYYRQGRIITILKWAGLNVMAFLMLVLLMSIFFIYSAIQS